ncbi:LLM class flavin-dependent oxidoreductase [Nocardia sp. NPDC050406]|uniref:LLM class flavin-dependent oxidoreductase n=1 Tax=Nocardia sp. NPDC050406 TaxID=3364318 RepID=UPI0037A0108B
MNSGEVLFGLGLESDATQVDEILAHARTADNAGLDLVTLSDHPYFAQRLDAYSVLAFVLGATRNITAATVMTHLPNRPAPQLARTVTGLSTISGGRFALGIGAGGGLPEESRAFGSPQLAPAARVRALEEAVILIRALSGGGEPVTFDGEFYQVTDLAPAAAQTPPIWIGALGPKMLALTGRHADGWIPGHLADWRSPEVAQGRPIIDEAATAAGRNPADITTIYNVAGTISRDPLARTRTEEGRWIGGSVAQWVEELTYAVVEHRAGAFIYLARPGDIISDDTVDRWAHEVVPAVREAIAQH